MPALLSAATISPACRALLLSAFAAVVACVCTPKSNEAWSGVASTVPLPVTVIVVPERFAAPPELRLRDARDRGCDEQHAGDCGGSYRVCSWLTYDTARADVTGLRISF